MPSAGSIHVVVATDGSKEAEDAIRTARGLLNPTAIAAITVVTAINPVRAVAAYADLSVNLWQELDDAAKQGARQALDAARALLQGIDAPIDYEATEGSPADEVIRIARERGAGLIVIGSRGWGGVKSMLLGSVSDRVVHGAHCPVLVVRPAEHHR